MAVGHEPDTIFAEPTTLTGSIGVIIPHYDLGRLDGQDRRARKTRSPAGR